jgi:two-component system, chemotaxis family, sensor kinase CheA
MNEFLAQFLVESRELVEHTTDDLLALEQVPDDGARLDSAFRGFHTLKGAAGIVDFAAMGRGVHAAEDLLEAVRTGEQPVTADLVSNCLACLDQVVRWLDAIEAEGALPADAEAAAARLVARLASPAGPSLAGARATSAAEDPDPPWAGGFADTAGVVGARTAIRYTPNADCFFRGEDPLGLMSRLPGLLALDVRPLQPWPPLEELDPFAANLVIDALSSASSKEVVDHLRPVSDQVQIDALRQGDDATFPDRAAKVLKAQLALLSAPRGQEGAGRWASAGRVAGNVLRHLGLEAEAAVIDAALARSLAEGDPAALLAALEATVNAAPASTPREGGDGPGRVPSSPQEAIARALRVDIDRIDAIVNLTGELTVVKNALGHAAERARQGTDPEELAQVLKQQHALLDRLTAELQRSVLAIRVLPLGHLFRRFSRPVRELARTLGKTLRLVIEGETTEADKAVVEALFEPLMHVLRNAVDHGVETAEQRRAGGKPETAVIQLRGRRQGEHVVVEVADDGRGIDVVEVRRAAAARNLATTEALAALSDDAVVDLIFAPGFSTAGAVTDVSGRGVGMDAVRSAIERLGGRVAVKSRAGEGTTVRFVLPFTVMMTRVMTVEAAGQVFGVPFDAIVETLQLARDGIVAIGAAEAFVLRGRTVPLISLARALDADSTIATPSVANIVVIETGGQLAALEVDRFGERLDVMLKPMDGLLGGTTLVAGTTLLGDGRVLIVLDPLELLQ